MIFVKKTIVKNNQIPWKIVVNLVLAPELIATMVFTITPERGKQFNYSS